MRVFVTGASGFIGSHVTRALVAAGHEVAALRQSGDSAWRLRDVAGRVVFVAGDLGDVPGFRTALEVWRPEACVHLAWYAEPGKYLDSPINLDCLAGSLALLRTLADLGCRRVIGVGSCAEYRRAAVMVDEDAPVGPDTVYAACKLAFKVAAEPFAALRGLRFAWARVFYLYGPDEDPRRLIPSAIQAMVGGESFPTGSGDQRRDYLHVHDVAAGLVRLVDAEATGAFNVASGATVTVREILETVADLAGPSCRRLLQFGVRPPGAWDPPFVGGDNRRLRATGWAPHYDLRDGLRQTLEWWRERLDGRTGERPCD